MEISTIIGSLGGILTTLSALPQAIKSFKEKSVKDISLYMYILLCIGVLLWLIYGLMVKDYVVIIANGVSLIINMFILVLKIRYK